MDATALPSGTVYPVLSRAEERGHVVSHWEDAETHRREGRPARKYYRLTPEGREALEEALNRLRQSNRFTAYRLTITATRRARDS